MTEEIERLTADVLSSRKYAQIVPGLVQRLVEEELAKGRKTKEVVKAVRNKLHQVGGAYLSGTMDYPLWLSELRAVQHSGEFKQVCQMVMSQHASTLERLPILNEFYPRIFELLPPIGSILDVACGLNPLALPWMPLWPEVTYYACDMYADMINFLNPYFARIPVDGFAEMRDVAVEGTGVLVDVGGGVSARESGGSVEVGVGVNVTATAATVDIGVGLKKATTW